MTSVAVVILTHNEALHIGRAIASVRPFATQIFVVDSGSTDETVALARAADAWVLSNPWTNYAVQFQWAMDNAPITADWVLRLDADEVVEADLAQTIANELGELPNEVSGITFDRKHIFMGRWIRHGGRYPLRLLRLFRRGKAHVEQRWMDEHIVVENGRIMHFAGGFADHNLNDLTFFTAKHNGYATREAMDVLNRRHGLAQSDTSFDAKAVSRNVAVTRWLKLHVFNALPFAVSTPAYFLYRYIFQLGFLDGREGLIYHFLQGFWYRFLVGAKVAELERGLTQCATPEAKRSRLRELTGLAV
jgi:glycosyltransferase involved in cell wall biosynthesis